MASKLAGSVALITGAGSGLGKATAFRLANQGVKVAIMDIKGLERTKEEIMAANKHADVLSLNVDVSNEQDVAKAVQGTVKAYGKIDYAVNCAGIVDMLNMIDGGSKYMQHVQKIFSVNVMGTFNVSKYCAEAMAKNPLNEQKERGVIIHTASIAAFDGFPSTIAYSSSKGAIVGMTLPMARELAPHAIRVNCICPGAFYTGMTDNNPLLDQLIPLIPFPKRMGDPSEYAQFVQALMENPMMNASITRIDAAWRM